MAGTLREALIAAVERSGKLDDLITEAQRRKKRNRSRYRAKRAAARRDYLQGAMSC